MDKRLIFITGGCRSGKSRFALDYANQHYSKKLYLATSEILDEEMVRRVEEHKKSRGKEWLTVEEPIGVVEKIEQYQKQVEVILLDCITLWLSNLLLKWNDEEKVRMEIERFTRALKEVWASLILVSNEVGMGIVPVDPLGRRFRDLSGMANQRIAEVADTVILMVSGMPIFLKGQA
jgi:adenosylcobinamide kinase/adenosylcobinamide-phosphate guanylyltransferase